MISDIQMKTLYLLFNFIFLFWKHFYDVIFFLLLFTIKSIITIKIHPYWARKKKIKRIQTNGPYHLRMLERLQNRSLSNKCSLHNLHSLAQFWLIVKVSLINNKIISITLNYNILNTNWFIVYNWVCRVKCLYISFVFCFFFVFFVLFCSRSAAKSIDL